MIEPILARFKENTSRRASRNYEEQYWYGGHFLSDYLNINDVTNKNILEVGCSSAGLLRYFHENGANCWGIELSNKTLNNAKLWNEDINIKLLQGDICDQSLSDTIVGKNFDIIIIRDVIEHVSNPKQALKNMFSLLKTRGIIFISCPSKWSPYSGHQQIATNPICKLPYFYLLPGKLYNATLKLLGQTETMRAFLIETKERRLTVNNLQGIIKYMGFRILKKDLYFIRPAYQFRFGFKMVKNIFSEIPILMDIFSNGMIFLITKK